MLWNDPWSSAYAMNMYFTYIKYIISIKDRRNPGKETFAWSLMFIDIYKWIYGKFKHKSRLSLVFHLFPHDDVFQICIILLYYVAQSKSITFERFLGFGIVVKMQLAVKLGKVYVFLFPFSNDALCYTIPQIVYYIFEEPNNTFEMQTPWS